MLHVLKTLLNGSLHGSVWIAEDARYHIIHGGNPLFRHARSEAEKPELEVP